MTSSTLFSRSALAAALSLALLACSPSPAPSDSSAPVENQSRQYSLLEGQQARLDIYKKVPLSSDLSAYSAEQKHMLRLLIEAAEIIDELFWRQAFGDSKQQFLDAIADPQVRDFARINYGPWDRLAGDAPFLNNTAAKPAGAQFYPADMSKVEFEQSDFADKTGLYSMVVRDANGKLTSIPYAEMYKAELLKIADLLRQASALASDAEFANYLQLRADALLSNQYQMSDFAWMDMKNNPIELVLGPIETYEDQLFGYRAAFEAYVLLKDLSWSDRLSKYAAYLPELQQGLPVAAQYKAQMPGTDADLNAYDVIYYAGHANSGSKTIAINLPNDEEVQLQKGTRRLQLKNAMQAKFDHIMLPIAEELIVPEQRQHITFTAFFANTMFHEVAHGLGIKTVLDSDDTVRQALKEHASALEEGKADILGIYMVRQLLAKGVISEGTLEDYYVTFMAGIFRSVRFGASSAHGKANMIRFNFFNEYQAFSRNEQGYYQVNMEKMSEAIDALSNLILTLQGDGNYSGVGKLVADKGNIKPQLAEDLARLTKAAIPVDIDFEQGITTLGL